MKGEAMNPPSPPSELQEIQLQEADISALNETSLPAEQVIAEQRQDQDALEHLTPLFIP